MHLRERLARHGMSLVGGFLYFNCKDDILKKSANKFIETAKVIIIMKYSILRIYYGFHR